VLLVVQVISQSFRRRSLPTYAQRPQARIPYPANFQNESYDVETIPTRPAAKFQAETAPWSSDVPDKEVAEQPSSLVTQAENREDSKPTDLLLPPRPSLPPRPTSSSETQRLMRELWDCRREMRAIAAREKILYEKLTSLGVTVEPSPGPNGGPPIPRASWDLLYFFSLSCLTQECHVCSF
jgi:hypothetical protein